MCSCMEHQIWNRMFLIVLFLSGAAAHSPGLTAAMPGSITALSGSCVLIPCLFNATTTSLPNLTLNSKGVWIINDTRFGKFPQNVIYNSSNLNNSYSMKIVGNLTERNCTSFLDNITQNHVNSYYFRLEDPSFRATADQNACKIKVDDVPPRPTITDPESLKEGVSVSVTCSAVAPCPTLPPELKWTGPKGTATVKTLQENSDRTKSAQLTVNFTTAAHHHGTNITCKALYPTNSQKTKASEATVTLNVSFSPKNTSASIHPTDLVSGSNVTLTCTSSANPPVSNFSWVRISGNTSVGVGDTLTIKVTEAEKGSYICVARNHLGQQSSPEVQLTIRGQPTNILYYAIIGGSPAMLLLVLVLLAVWRKSSGSVDRGAKMTASPSEQTLPVGREETHATRVPVEAEEPPSQSEEIQYGEIDFSKLQHKADRNLEKCSEDTEYSEVRKGGGQPPTPDPEDLYAQVKK
ncbi:myelin-associated glycoprotein isoform X2 [Osmerus eperlanus]|uniref:myelin-associated glycoprotein isoform X2 n=1 Tax=Osmerus eperlanus TaxID=29151 RepID=UPI002E110ADB